MKVKTNKSKVVDTYLKNFAEQDIDKSRSQSAAFWLTLNIFLAILYYRSFWIADDAYISFRHIDMLINGNGLSFNSGERVQGFTNVLWTLILVPVFAALKNAYWSVFLSQLICLLIVVRAAWYLTERNTTWLIAFIALFLLLQPLWDYSASGLENSLSHVLCILITYNLTSQNVLCKRKAQIIYLLCGLLVTNRFDFVFIGAPICLYVLSIRFSSKRQNALLEVWPGLIAILPWLAFSTLYYGFPFPNTAYAKLNIEWPLSERLWHGYLYWASLANTSFLSILLILTSPTLLLSSSREIKALAISAWVYLAYITTIGGDHMLGRFFSPPLMIILCCHILNLKRIIEFRDLIRFRNESYAASVILGMTLISNGTYFTALRDPINYKEQTNKANSIALTSINDIMDERAVWNAYSNPSYQSMKTYHSGWNKGVNMEHDSSTLEKIKISGAMGYEPYYAPRDVHFVDKFGLTDPLLSKLHSDAMHFNHYTRDIPDGYIESLASDSNKIADTSLHKYYDILRELISGPIFSSDRLKNIWRINMGQYNHLLHEYQRDFEGLPAESNYYWLVGNADDTGEVYINERKVMTLQGAYPKRAFARIQKGDRVSILARNLNGGSGVCLQIFNSKRDIALSTNDIHLWRNSNNEDGAISTNNREWSNAVKRITGKNCQTIWERNAFDTKIELVASFNLRENESNQQINPIRN